MKRGFPNWIPKTDETRIQSVPRVLEDAVGIEIYVAEKLDGSSYTVFLKDDEFGVCSRNQEKKEIPTCHFWEATRRLGIEEKLRGYKQKTGRELALQGELVGPGIQKNKYGLTERTIYFFNAFDVASGRFVDYQELLSIVLDLDVQLVPVLFTGSGTKIGDPGFATVDDFVKLSTIKTHLYPQSVWAEGIVVRPTVEQFHRKLGRFSFKTINPEFLLKYDG
jgi:RNA ligase (TIGR02306 family)